MTVFPTMDINATSARLGIDFNQIDFDSIHLPPGEDCGIQSDDDEEFREDDDSLEFEQGFRNIIVTDNLPQVPKEKHQKLEGVIKKIYSQFGAIKEDWMPKDPVTEKSLGYTFIEFNTPQEAEAARDKTNCYPFDKSHKFAVNMFDEIDSFMRVPDQWSPPETKEYSSGENLQNWLMDVKGRDQFVIRAGDDTEVLWNDVRLMAPSSVHKQTRWTESYAQWSPLGTYLVTLHEQGAVVWGGASGFCRLMRFSHPQVKRADFSPGEKYLVTFSSHEPRNPSDTQSVVLNIFNVRTGKVMRKFTGTADEFAGGGVTGVSRPVFKWAGGSDDKYFARIGKNAVFVYETDSFSLIDKKPIKAEKVMDFSWSPTDPIMSIFVPEHGNQPAKVSLIQIPSKVELRQKNLFSVKDIKMYWQSKGEYLAVKVDRYTKTKKSTYTGFELFHIKERDIPIEVLELENKNDNVLAFAWEPKGDRFAVIHGHNNPRPDVSFYTMKTGRVQKLITVQSKQADSLYWSPEGRFILLAGLKTFQGQLEFYNVDELETMASTEHFMATSVEWDPSGRYVVTSENGFNVWSFHGKLLYRVLKDHFHQFQWRPRPPSLLTSEKEEEVQKNLKKYSKRYEEDDQDVSMKLSESDRERRKMIKDEWEMWLKEWKCLREEERLERIKLRDGEVSDDEPEEFESKDIEVEEVINVTEEVDSLG